MMTEDEELEQTYKLIKMDKYKENWLLKSSELTQMMLEDIIGPDNFISLRLVRLMLISVGVAASRL